MVGNAGVLLSDGATSLLIDLPYESGAFGYMTYEASRLAPAGAVTSIVTHDHRDHFDPTLFLERETWRVVGPPSVVGSLPAGRVTEGDSLTLGAFEVVAIPTPHTDDHRSYRIRWRGRVLHFVGDTEDPNHLGSAEPIDLLFVTPWLSCSVAPSFLRQVARRTVAYHLRPRGDDQICGAVDRLGQGSSVTLRGSAEGDSPR